MRFLFILLLLLLTAPALAVDGVQIQTNGALISPTNPLPEGGATSNAVSGVATGAVSIPTVSYNYGFNGSTWDQVKTGDVNNAGSITGIWDALMIGRYNSTQPTITNGQWNALQIGLNGSLSVQLMVKDGTAGVRTLADNADAVAVAAATTNLTATSRGYVFNGTSWDRAYGNTTGGATISPQPYPPVVACGAACATPITGNATGSTGAVVGTLAAAAAKTTYICGFNISATGGVATIGPIVVAGLVGSSQTYQLFSTATGAQLPVTFSPCIPGSAVNTAITITTTADGTASAVDVNSWGYQQ